ncbi:hypothetical protein Tco_0485394 [Tanacetum coccineum]
MLGNGSTSGAYNEDNLDVYYSESIRFQRGSIRCIQDIVCEYSGRYQAWSLLQETPIAYLILDMLDPKRNF